VPPSFQVVRRLFEAALDLPAEQQRAWLQAESGGDAELLAEVWRMLELDAKAAPVLDRGPSALPVLASLGERLIGVNIGSLRILRVLGSGGMGTVYEAEQSRPQRRVALKVMRHGFGGPRARARFEYEAEILARLQHPGIAQVYEAGVFADGSAQQPYFAMELIDGARPLDAFARELGDDVAEALALFGKVCEAVHHGHQRGVVHRDLKPANILVDGNGQPKLIDFGIARAEGASWHATLTNESGSVLGTLAYMSPEQLDAGGAANDTRVDVYALGVILFQLLAGRLPLELGELPLGAATDAIRHREPPRLSQCKDRRALPADLGWADLDWIVQKAMAKDPERRYASAQALLEDLQRLQRGEPVLAGPPSAAYRLRKFVRRNRIAVAAAGAALLALLLGTIATAIGWQHALAAETLAEGRREEAQQLADDLWQVTQLQSEILGSARGDRNAKLADVVERSRARITGLVLSDQVAAELHAALGVSFDSLGLTDAAREQFELAEKRVAGGVAASSRTALLVKSQHANLLAGIGKVQEAEPMLREVLREDLARFGPDHRDTAMARGNLASVLSARGDHAGADELYRLALPVLAISPGKQHYTTITAMTGHATVLHKLHRDEEALALYTEACALATEHLGAEDPTTLSCDNTFAVFLFETGKLDAARERFEKLGEVRARVSGPAHPATLRVYSNLALCHERQHRYTEAVAIYRRILQARQGAGGGKELTDLITRFNLAVALHLQDLPEQVEEALEVLTATIADAEQVLPADNWRLAVFRQHRGLVLCKLRRFEEAERALAAARAVLEKTLGPTDQRTRSNWEMTADLFEAWGRNQDAAQWRQKLTAK
jgi:eukaryotic-like serine/threonine-protein kinase